jgi:HK97 family phage prohead protease
MNMDIRHAIITNAIVRVPGLGPNMIRVIASDGSVDRMGDIVEPGGLRLQEIPRRGVPFLAQHDAEAPIARATRIWRDGDRIMADVTFPPEGTSQKSDEYLRLIKADVVDAVSIGFNPHRSEALPRGGLRFVDWSLLEISAVSVPANVNAIIAAKKARRIDAQDGLEIDRKAKRLSEILREIGRPPLTSTSGQLLSDAERRALRVAEVDREETRRLVDSPRYAELRNEAADRRIFEVRARTAKLERAVNRE